MISCEKKSIMSDKYDADVEKLYQEKGENNVAALRNLKTINMEKMDVEVKKKTNTTRMDFVVPKGYEFYIIKESDLEEKIEQEGYGTCFGLYCKVRERHNFRAIRIIVAFTYNKNKIRTDL